MRHPVKAVGENRLRPGTPNPMNTKETETIAQESTRCSCPDCRGSVLECPQVDVERNNRAERKRVMAALEACVGALVAAKTHLENRVALDFDPPSTNARLLAKTIDAALATNPNQETK